jgi:rhodanese-related sulfurtransferase
MDYSSKFQAIANAARAQVNEVPPEEVDQRMAEGTVVLDIRDSEEHAKDHIPGSVNLSRGKLEMLIESKVPDLETPILTYCNAYNRGSLSAAALQSMGYRNVSVIAGGLNAYRALKSKA